MNIGSRASRRSRLGPAVRGVALATVLSLGAVACSSDGDEAGDAFPLQNPSAAEVEAATGLDFPDTKSDYRSVNVGQDALYVSFSLPAADVDGFAEASGLDLAGGTRLLAHPSPLWPEGDPAEGTAVSGTRATGGYDTQVEVWTDGTDVAVVRIGIRTS